MRWFRVCNTGDIIIDIEVWYDDLNNEPAVCPYTNLIPSGQVLIYLLLLLSGTFFSGRFRHVNILQQYI